MFNNRKYETQRAYELLAKGTKGDVISAADMESHVGRPCWDAKCDGYRYVNSAIKQAIKYGVYWYRDRNGKRYVCGSVDDIINAQQSHNKKAFKAAGRSLDVAVCCKTDEMSPTQLSQHNLNTLVAGMVRTAASAPTRKRLEGKSFSQPSPDDLMKLCLKSND